jgi:hypothetical protein
MAAEQPTPGDAGRDPGAAPPAAPLAAITALRDRWRAVWPQALAVWSRYVQLSEPRWCETEQAQAEARLADGFACIRLVDHAILIGLPSIAERGLDAFALEILAHEVGHHVYCPADLSDNARLLARVRRGLPTREQHAPYVANLYADLLVNDRLQRSAGLDLAGVYRALGDSAASRLWTLFLRIYEVLWSLPRQTLARGESDARLDGDAVLGARVVRSYAKDWLGGAGRFACLCLPYLLADEAAEGRPARRLVTAWHDTREAGRGGLPDGLGAYDPDEEEGAIHPAEDEAISGVPRGRGAAGSAAPGRDPDGVGGRKNQGGWRGPVEYQDVVLATGAALSAEDLVAQYYRERARPYVVRFPTRASAPLSDPLPEGEDAWELGDPLESIDWLATLRASPLVVPGVTTRQRRWGTDSGGAPERVPLDLYVGVDCSGSMMNPARGPSYPVVAGTILTLSALRVGARVMVALSGEPGRTVTTDGFLRDERAVLRVLTSYLGTGMGFGIHRLAETFRDRPRDARAVHILVVSDSDVFHLLDQTTPLGLGWDIAAEALERARGGGTYVLELPHTAPGTAWGDRCAAILERMRAQGWAVEIVTSQEDLVPFARRFSERSYGAERAAAPRPGRAGAGSGPAPATGAAGGAAAGPAAGAAAGTKGGAP